MTPGMRPLIIAQLLALAGSAAHADTITGRASAIDGDTVEIHGQRIRILDIDAPESRQTCSSVDGSEWRCGQKAALALSNWLGAQTVECESDRLDRYQRHLARCSVKGEDVATWLAENGALSAAALASLPPQALADAVAFAAQAAAITCSRRGADMPRRAELGTRE